MDHVACVQRFVEAMEGDDFEEAIAARDDLREWFNEGDVPSRWTIDVSMVLRIMESFEPGAMIEARQRGWQL